MKPCWHKECELDTQRILMIRAASVAAEAKRQKISLSVYREAAQEAARCAACIEKKEHRREHV